MFKTQHDVLVALKDGSINITEAQELLAQFDEKPVSFKVAEKGISVLGLHTAGRPVTFNVRQWRRLLAHQEQLVEVMEKVESGELKYVPEQAA